MVIIPTSPQPMGTWPSVPMTSRENLPSGSEVPRTINNGSSNNTALSLAGDKDVLGPLDRVTPYDNETILAFNLSSSSLKDKNASGTSPGIDSTLSSSHPSATSDRISAVLLASGNDVAAAHQMLDTSTLASSQTCSSAVVRSSNSNLTERRWSPSEIVFVAALAEFLHRHG